jgi:hypothetical protein
MSDMLQSANIVNTYIKGWTMFTGPMSVTEMLISRQERYQSCQGCYLMNNNPNTVLDQC